MFISHRSLSAIYEVKSEIVYWLPADNKGWHDILYAYQLLS